METKYRPSLEWCKRLKEFGFPQDGCDAYWVKQPNWEKHRLWDGTAISEFQTMRFIDEIAAPCVGRLGEELGNINYHVPNKNEANPLHKKYRCGCYIRDIKTISVEDNTEANARAAMYCKLVEEGLI